MKRITLNSSSHNVSSNLFSALRQLRRREEQRVLWVDALCINQNDMTEKATQILLMGNIYSDIESTIAWLGEFDVHLLN